MSISHIVCMGTVAVFICICAVAGSKRGTVLFTDFESRPAPPDFKEYALKIIAEEYRLKKKINFVNRVGIFPLINRF